MKLAYFVHDLTDPAVARRVRMLKAGGAEPVLVGFRRADAAPETLEDCRVYDLGRTYDGRLGHRAKMAARAALASGRLRRALAGSEVVLARTLEMLAVAEAARWTCGLAGPLVYECLDVHRTLVQDTVRGYALRTIERRLMRRASGLIVSSPAFLDQYFRPIQGLGDDLHLPAMLVENKVLELGPPAPRPQPPPAGPPWRIGWLGALRCRKSLAALRDLAARRPDLVDVRLHGRPAYSEFEDFDAEVSGLPNLRFGGAYTAADLPRLYGELHFAWAIDFMEEGLNSAWLLPNRLYEASRYGALPIALSDVQTGRWLAERGFGVRLPRLDDLEGTLEGLTPPAYAALRAELEAVPVSAFVADESACRRLVEGLKGPAEAFGSHGQAADSNNQKIAA
jgi:hypothetical protein